VVSTASGSEKINTLLKIGADQVVNIRQNVNKAILSDGTEEDLKTPFDLVIDTIGGEEYEDMLLPLLRKGGHYISLRGPLLSISDKYGLINGVLRTSTNTLDKKIKLWFDGIKYNYILYENNARALRTISNWVNTGLISTFIHPEHFTLADIDKAFECYEHTKPLGKVIISIHQ